MSKEIIIRFGFFSGIFALMAIWELLTPRRILTTSKTARWFSNLSIAFLNAVVIRLVFPITALSMALVAQERGWGLLNHYNLPYWLIVTVGVITLDFAIYFQHVLLHAVPVLWRLHTVHHADLDFDVTTGIRFHPLEIILSMGIKLAAVSVLGPPVLAVLIFEVLLNGTSMFNHSNIRLPSSIEHIVRLFVVTPDMHRIHHSALPDETNKNFGFNLPWWDRLFGTYQNEPVAGHERMTIGLFQFQDIKHLTSLPWMLTIPFMKNPGNYTLSHREIGSSKF